MSINKSTKVRTPCNCGSDLYNISGIPENQCFDCYKGRCACGIHDVLCTKCNKASQITPCKCGSGLYNIPNIPENQCFDCYKGSMKVHCKCGSGLYNIPNIPENQCYDCYNGPKCKCGIFYVFCKPCLKNSK